MTEESNVADEAREGEDIADAPEKVEGDDSEAPKEAETTEEGESTEGGDAEAEKPKETPEELTKKEKRKKDRAYKARLRAKASDAEKRVQDAERRRERIINAGESTEAPVETEFSDYTEYVAAKAVWTHAKSERDRMEKEIGLDVDDAKRELDEVTQAEAQAIERNFAQQVQGARSRYADFDAVVTADDVNISGEVASIIAQSDVGADLAYHVASDKALADELSAMKPIEAAMALGRIESSLKAPPSRTTSTAPNPIKPVTGRTTPTKDPEKMSFLEFAAAREAGKI